MRNITVFGANGRVGQLVVNDLLERGHKVTAFVHNTRGLEPSSKLTVVEGDVHDPVAVAKALVFADCVISTLGSWGTPGKDIVTTGVRHIIPVMQSQGIDRIISLTGAESRAKGDALGVVHRLAHFGAGLIAKKILADGEDHIKLLEASELHWTVIRSPIMNERGSHKYRLNMSRPKPWQSIHRRAVADAIVQQLNDSRYYGKSPFINR